jgi:hypothetical protein
VSSGDQDEGLQMPRQSHLSSGYDHGAIGGTHVCRVPPLPTCQQRKTRTTGPGFLLIRTLTCSYAYKLGVESVPLASSVLGRLVPHGGLGVVGGLVSDQFSDHGGLVRVLEGQRGLAS